MQLTPVLAFLLSFALFFPVHGETEFSRSKLEQYAGEFCDGEHLEHSVNLGGVLLDEECITLNSKTKSVWIGHGTGLVWRRRVTLYSEKDCRKKLAFGDFTDTSGYFENYDGRTAKSTNCVPVEFIFEGSYEFKGRLVSILFEAY